MPIAALLLGAIFWGLVWYPLRLLEEAGLAGPWQTLVSYTGAALALLLFMRIDWGAWRRHPAILLVLALVAGWTNVAFVLAILDGTVVRVLLFFYLSPIWASILGVLLLGERLDRVTMLVLPTGILGAVVMLWTPEMAELFTGEGLVLSDWLALSSGMAFAITNVLTRQLQDIDVRNKTLIYWLGVILVSVFVLIPSGMPIPDVDREIWFYSLLLGILGFSVITLAVVYAVTRMPVQRSAIILLFEILVGGISAWLIAGEQMTVQEWVGGFLILVSGFYAAIHVTEDQA